MGNKQTKSFKASSRGTRAAAEVSDAVRLVLDDEKEDLSSRVELNFKCKDLKKSKAIQVC
jgi:hypothetical protein